MNFLIENAKKYGINLSEYQANLLISYKNEVLEQNKTMNLTAITDENEFIEKHILDSLCGGKFLQNQGSLIDVGCGGGFPSVPLAIAFDKLAVTAIDSTAKKINFISNATKKLKIENLTAVTARAEDLGRGACRNKFDFATARAVSNLKVLIELIVPLLKVGGKFVAYKANDSEIGESQNALKALNCKIVETANFSLPCGDSRCLIVIEKTADTPSLYPRQYSQIKNKPL